MPFWHNSHITPSKSLFWKAHKINIQKHGEFQLNYVLSQKRHSMMKRSYLIVLILTMLIGTGCKRQTIFSLQGILQELMQSGMLLVTYDDPLSYTDTIFADKEGRFDYTIEPDTLTIFRLINEQGKSIPIFAEKGEKMLIKGNFDHFETKGEGLNAEYQDFRNSINPLKGNRQAEAAEAEKFIKSHPQSVVSAYLINDYFVQVANPDIEKIRSLIDPLTGNVKDSRILSIILKSLPQTEDNGNNTYLNYFSYKDRNGKYVSTQSNENKYVIINFWASWNRESQTECDSLRAMLATLPPQTAGVLNISLDMDKQAWLNACREDDRQWTEVCDFKGWNTQIVKQNEIQVLPANIVIDKSRKIWAKDLYGKALKDKMLELTRQESSRKK